MKVLLTGGGGQLGRALVASAPAGVTLLTPDAQTLDITDADAVTRIVAAHRPDWIINAAAYTDVDRAESEEAWVHAVNARGVGHLAAAAEAAGARLAHVSTDFVFDGRAGAPYAPDSATGPLSAYGRTKLAGERLAGPRALIVRTAWLHSATGRNFVRTMLRLMAGGQPVRVVADQIGTPTHAPGLAACLWTLIGQDAAGIFHHTDSGTASWYDFAVAIQEEALRHGLLAHGVPVVPIATADRPAAAKRPAFAVLDKSATIAVTGVVPPHWRVALRAMLAETARG